MAELVATVEQLAATARPPDPSAVAARVAAVAGLLDMHAGGIELDEVDDEGRVRVRFTGSCTGCPYRPVTLYATIRPALLELPGVTAVEVTGLRISEQAQARLHADLGGWWRP